MRNRLPIAIAAVLALLLGWRACAGSTDPAAPSGAAPGASTDEGTRGHGEAGQRPVAAPTRQAFAGAASTVQAYLSDLGAGDLVRAGRWWAGRKPDVRGDALLRAAVPVRGLRITTGVPRALDDEVPPRAVEVPVRLRLGDDETSAPRLQGHYWLRATGGSGGWEITSATLQPDTESTPEPARH